jgi:hypothetical protein
MATSLAIEKVVLADVSALLVAAGLVVHNAGARLAESTDYSAGRVAVGATYAGPSLLGGQWSAGYPRIALTLTCETYLPDDPNGDTMRTLAESVRNVIEVEELSTNLTAQSSTATYYALMHGPSFDDSDGNISGLTLTYTLILRPTKP